jgi:hypothetical protein
MKSLRENNSQAARCMIVNKKKRRNAIMYKLLLLFVDDFHLVSLKKISSDDACKALIVNCSKNV